MKNIIYLVALCWSSTFFAQQSIRGVVRDDLSKNAIPNVLVSMPAFQITVRTDINGQFTIPISEFDKQVIRFQHPDYKAFDTILAENASVVSIYLKIGHMVTEEVTVSGQQVALRHKNTVPIEVRSIKDLQLSGAINVTELMTKIPGVYSSSLGNGIAKPVIRGMQGMRVVTLVNGLRLEGQQWGGDHGLGIGELALGSVELIKGPASVLYGADALGGVIYLVDEPYARINQQVLEVQQKWNQNTNGSHSTMLYKNSFGNKRFLVAGSYANHADFQLPNGLYAKNSRFHESVWKASYSWFKPHQIHQIRYAFNNTVTGIPGHTHDTLISPLSFQVAQQGRKYSLPAQFFTNQLISYEFKRFWKEQEWNVLLGQTHNRLVEYDEKVTKPFMDMDLLNSVYQTKWTRKWSKKQLIVGAAGMLQYNLNAPIAEDELLPNAVTIDQGIFGLFKLELTSKQLIQVGLRQDIRWIQTKNLTQQLNKRYMSPNLSLGWSWQPNQSLSNQLNLASGFRSPHLSELLADGFHHGALRYEIGDVNLKPERSIQLDLSSEWSSEHGSIQMNPYHAWVQDYIYLQPNGTSIDGIPVFHYEQLNSGRLYGLDVQAHYHPHWLHNLHWEGTFSYIQFQTPQDSAISMLPPTRVQNEIRYHWEFQKVLKKLEVGVNHTWIAAQTRVAYQETPSQSYQLVHLNARIYFEKQSNWVLQTGIRNLTNTTYIDHLSRLKNIGMPGPGRYFYLSVKYQFQKTKEN
ncbi:MAG: TonB-dependent receptor [Flavobacteriales bacterium]